MFDLTRPQIDRHNKYYNQSGLFFPHHENPVNPLRDTLLDGELVIDVDPRTKKVFHDNLWHIPFIWNLNLRKNYDSLSLIASL